MFGAARLSFRDSYRDTRRCGRGLQLPRLVQNYSDESQMDREILGFVVPRIPNEKGMEGFRFFLRTLVMHNVNIGNRTDACYFDCTW